MGHHLADIRNLQALVELFTALRPQFVFHLAAQALVNRSYADPAATYATNLLGTVNVLEAIRRSSDVQAAVMITSDKCYRNKEWAWGYRENDELGGLDPYGASKACAELAIQSYRESFFKTAGAPIIVSARAGNVIGGGDWSEKRIVPDIIRSLRANKAVELRNPRATRPWQHVLEPLSGYLWLGACSLGKGDPGSGWNFGPEATANVTVLTLSQMLLQSWGGGEIRDVSGNVTFQEATLLALDIAKAKTCLGWRPTLDLEETVQFTAAWYRDYLESKEMFSCSRAQIAAYTAKARERGLPWASR